MSKKTIAMALLFLLVNVATHDQDVRAHAPATLILLGTTAANLLAAATLFLVWTDRRLERSCAGRLPRWRLRLARCGRIAAVCGLPLCPSLSGLTALAKVFESGADQRIAQAGLRASVCSECKAFLQQPTSTTLGENARGQ